VQAGRRRGGPARRSPVRRPSLQAGRRHEVQRRGDVGPPTGSPQLLLPSSSSLFLPEQRLWRLRGAPHLRRLPRARRRGGGPGLPHPPLLLPLLRLLLLPHFLSFLRWTGRSPRGRRRSTGRDGWAATCRGAPRVWGCGSGRLGFHSGARGLHLVRQSGREGRPWLASAMGPALARLLPRAPTGCARERHQREEIRSDRLGPHGSERKRKVGNRWAGGFGGLKGTRWAAVWWTRGKASGWSRGLGELS
jgi:hypothetical protein